MRPLLFLLRKEFRQIFRNKSILAIIFVAPLMQLIILPLAGSYEMKNANIAVVDHDHSSYSRELVQKITKSNFFSLQYYGENYKDAFKNIEQEKADLILEIPNHFEKDLVNENKAKVLIAINAINGTNAGLSGNYLSQIIQNYNQNIQTQLSPQLSEIKKKSGLNVTSSLLFNRHYNYRLALVPGILAFLVTLVGGMLSALNIVSEKEIGTIEQINVSPLKKSTFILGKLIPFWILGLVVFTMGLIVARVFYVVENQGNLLLLYFFVGVYLLAILGFGLLISTYSETQQQAMFTLFFFIMIFILMSGLYTPIESMPNFAQKMTYLNPLRYLIDVVRLILLKNAGFKDLIPQFLSILGMAIVFNFWAIFNYRKTS
jgi:ABC-2 type transport system permease protein